MNVFPAVNEVQMMRESPDNFQEHHYHIDEYSMQSFLEPVQLRISNNLAANDIFKGDGPILESSKLDGVLENIVRHNIRLFLIFLQCLT